MFKLYIMTLPILISLDALWLGVLAKNFYGNALNNFIGKTFLIWPAAIFYLIYTLGILVFAVNPAIEAQSLSKAIILGAFLGLIAYSTYNLVNLSTLEGWPIKVVLIDTLWGMIVSGTVSAIIFSLKY